MSSMENKKYIHIHIPKTAGCFIKIILQKAAENNKNLKIIDPLADKTREDYSNPLKFHPSIKFVRKVVPLANDPSTEFITIVRNPYDRIYSLWKYFKKLNIFGSLIYPYVPENFEDYIDELNNGEYDQYYHMNSQLFFIDGNGENPLQIFKFEEIDTTVRKFFEQNGIKWQDEKVNDISSKSYVEVYTKRTADIVKNLYRNEFELFNYSVEI
jgi:hypothetical protein